MSETAQKWVLWWAIAFTVIYGLCLGFLLNFIPPPDATMTANEIGAWYNERHDQIRVGATITSWVGAFMLPLFAVITVQMMRLGVPRIWTMLCGMGGAMMGLFLMLPPLFWGVAAYTKGRDPEVTSLMHELGTLTLTSTDQYYIFAWVAIIVVCFLPTKAKYSPFTRNYGYFTAWTAFMFEAGAFVFLPRTGPFAWDGLLVFWSPLTLFGAWITVTCVVILRALKLQREHDPEIAPTTKDLAAA